MLTNKSLIVLFNYWRKDPVLDVMRRPDYVDFSMEDDGKDDDDKDKMEAETKDEILNFYSRPYYRN